MRPAGSVRGSVFGVALLATLLVCGSARAELDRADPLEVPTAPLPEPELVAELPFGVRLEQAEVLLRERGFRDLPVLAWAALDAAKDGTRPNFVEKALRLAPTTPGILFEAARQSRDRWAGVMAAFSLLGSFPGMLWLLSTLGVALGLGVLLATTLVVSVGYVRTLALHGHELGHFTDSIDPPSWPGMLLGIGVLALLPLFGMGPLIILAVAGLLATLRLPTRESFGVAVWMGVLGLMAGPLLDNWARISAVQGYADTLLAAWRVDRGQGLPGDEERLELATARDGQLLARLGLAAQLKRRGDLQATKALLDEVPASAPAGLRSQAFNILGSVHLAWGDLKESVEWFEDARAAEESAAVLYNLSQAYGRALRLEDHSALFVAARERDPALIREHTKRGGTTLHSYLIQPHIPLTYFLEQALAPTPHGDHLARHVRSWALGRRAPAWSWLLLPALGAAGAVARRKRISRCRGCSKVICQACSPGVATDTCVTCQRLRTPAGPSDPRLRRAQLDLDRARRRRVRVGLVGAGIVVPGLPGLFEGRAVTGCLRIAGVGVALALLLVSTRLPGPWEIGDLAATLPNVFSALLLLPLYGLSLWESFQRLNKLRVSK